jgi:hypothetical protein
MDCAQLTRSCFEHVVLAGANQSSGTKKQAAVLDTVHDLLLAIDRMSPGYQPEGPGARSIACGMAYRKFSWLADHGRVTIALAIPMATRHFYMLGSVHVPVSKHIRAAASGPTA